MKKWLERLVAMSMTISALLLVTGCGGLAERPAAPPSKPVAAVRTGTFSFDGWNGPPLRVWYGLPDQVRATTPVVFVMHGVNRDADRYLAEWAPLAARYRFIVVVPEFSQASFPGSAGYNTGYLTDPNGAPRPRAQWSFAALEPLFDAVKARTGSRMPRYALYGHSAGAQFVHRYVFFVPEARLSRAVAANAGWYTMPNLATAYPYGLAGAPIGAAGLKRALRKPLTILLGTSDTDVTDPNLRITPEANAQGPHRFARGMEFHRMGRATAGRLGGPFGWRVQDVPGVGHDNGKMAVAAAPLLVQ